MVNVVDLDNDCSKITEEELETTERLLTLEINEKKAESQKKMAWISLISMIVFILILFTPLISIERLQALSELFGLYFIAVSGILGAYMGFSTWESNNALNNSDNRTTVYRNHTNSGKMYLAKKIPD